MRSQAASSRADSEATGLDESRLLARHDRGPALGMIADDLTGACDTGAQFALQGFRTVVQIGRGSAGAENGRAADMLVLTTASRAGTAEVAREKVRLACLFLLRKGVTVLYKKIDSTLRGHVGPEIEATLETCGHPFAVVTPAFPAMGRTMAEGWLRLHGRAGSPGVHLPTLLRSQGVGGVAHLGGDAVRAGPAALQKTLERLHPVARRCLCVDAGSVEDLAIIARAALSLTPAPLLVGSAGLAAQAAAVLAERTGRCVRPDCDGQAEAEPDDGRSDRGAVVLFIGSPHPITAAQVARLAEGGHALVVPLDDRAAESACAVQDGARSTVLSVQWTAAGRARFLPKIAPLVEARRPCGMVLSGGDTAALVCRALGAHAIRLEGEIAPGLPWGRLIGGRAHGMAVCTKSGGFGGEEALIEAVGFLSHLT